MVDLAWRLRYEIGPGWMTFVQMLDGARHRAFVIIVNSMDSVENELRGNAILRYEQAGCLWTQVTLSIEMQSQFKASFRNKQKFR